jgi:Flp pilus assembly protein TadD
MIKRIVILATCAFTMFNATAQKSNIQSAINYLKDKEIGKAKKMLDEATVNESTKNNAKAWLLKAVVYQAIATPKSDGMPQLIASVNDVPVLIDLSDANQLLASTPNAATTSLEAYKMGISIDPKYSKDELYPLLANMVFMGFNNGITLMNDNKFNDAFTTFGEVGTLASLDNGKLFKGNGQMDTIFANAKMYQANSAYQSGKEVEALPIFEECLNNPITQSADLFIMTADVYEKQNNETKWMSTIKMAKDKYPSDKRIMNTEINYYDRLGKSDELIKKLKEAVTANPKDVDKYILLGQTYSRMANPEGKAKPANAKELEESAIANYKKAEELEPNNIYAQSNLAMLFFNQVVETNKVMNKADDKTYESMKAGRDVLINKSLPYLDKTKILIEREGINDSNKGTYKEILNGLLGAYNALNKADKVAEIQKAIQSVK